MQPSASSTPETAAALALRGSAVRELAGMALMLAAAGTAVAAAVGFGPGYVAKALVFYALAGAAMLRGLAAHAPHRRFGPGNRLTLGRLANVALLAAVLGEQPADPRTVAWGIVVVATVGAVLDAADGPLARAAGLASEFGSRFDMETDTLLMLVLCLLIVQFGKVGPWVLAAGLMRYAFVLAMRRWPWLGAPLPPSWRRKAVCVAQITCLIVCLGPIVPPPLASLFAAGSIAALTYSFAVDVLWLARRRLMPEPPSARPGDGDAPSAGPGSR